MTIRIGDMAPDFTAESTEGIIKFHEWIGDQWAILFSHPKDFTPICTTELGYMAGLKPEFEKRNTKIIGLSVDSISDHKKWDAQSTWPAKAKSGDWRCTINVKDAKLAITGYQYIDGEKGPHDSVHTPETSE